MSDGNGVAEAMLGLDGMKVLEVSEEPDELIITVETTATVVGCGERGTRRRLMTGDRPMSVIWPVSAGRCACGC